MVKYGSPTLYSGHCQDLFPWFFSSKSYWGPMLLWMFSFLVALVMFGGLATQKCGPWECIRMQNLGNLYTPTESYLHFHRMPKIHMHVSTWEVQLWSIQLCPGFPSSFPWGGWCPKPHLSIVPSFFHSPIHQVLHFPTQNFRYHW